jgi:hypothetical protein
MRRGAAGTRPRIETGNSTPAQGLAGSNFFRTATLSVRRSTRNSWCTVLGFNRLRSLKPGPVLTLACCLSRRRRYCSISSAVWSANRHLPKAEKTAGACRSKAGCSVGDERASILRTPSLQAHGAGSEPLQISAAGGSQRGIAPGTDRVGATEAALRLPAIVCPTRTTGLPSQPTTGL